MVLRKNVVVIAPIQLGNAFMVLLQSAVGVRPLAAAADVAVLVSTLTAHVPDVVLLYLDEDATGSQGKNQVTREQVSQIKATWPDAHCTVVVKDPRLIRDVEALGADIVFSTGVGPERLLESIESYGLEETTPAGPGAQAADSASSAGPLDDQLQQLGE